jgi:hypothetical protein
MKFFEAYGEWGPVAYANYYRYYYASNEQNVRKMFIHRLKTHKAGIWNSHIGESNVHVQEISEDWITSDHMGEHI